MKCFLLMLFWVYSERLLIEAKLWGGGGIQRRRVLKEQGEEKESAVSEDFARSQV